MPLQLSLLVTAVLLEIVANFAANASSNTTIGRMFEQFAGPVLIALLVLVIAGNAVVLRLEHPPARRPV
jgi:hypothetical protein